MLGLSAYLWWKFLHVVGVIAFVTFHGVSVMAALRVRKERDRGRIATMLRLTESRICQIHAKVLKRLKELHDTRKAELFV